MSNTRMQIAAICQIIMALAGATAAHAQAAGPCREIVVACREAGFTQGGARTGDGIVVDCVRPIMLGAAQPRRAAKPLPQIDPQIVAACKERNPDFGQQRNRAPNDTAPRNPPPPAGTEPAPLPDPPPQAGAGRVEAPALPAGAKRPNIVFVLTDDTDIHVPLIVTGPGVPAGGTVDEIVQNIDLCPTFAELGFAAAPPNVDGRSLAPLMRGEKVEE